jgi:hypothetical protein
MTRVFSKTADISADGKYRHVLTRRWAWFARPMLFVMLNPSTADGCQDDPTIRKCIGFAQQAACSGIIVVNLYDWRATKPADLWKAERPVSDVNDSVIQSMAQQTSETGGFIVAAWGAHARQDRIDQVRALPFMDDLWCYGTTKSGQPRHPLMLAYATELVGWPEVGSEVSA